MSIGADFDVTSEADKAFINKMGGLDNLGYDKSPEDMKNEVSEILPTTVSISRLLRFNLQQSRRSFYGALLF